MNNPCHRTDCKHNSNGTCTNFTIFTEMTKDMMVLECLVSGKNYKKINN